jgi:predicted hotdog family 3-hydroxylacyl-ACP dehydratase
MNLPSIAPVEEILPQRAPMRVIDALEHAQPNLAICAAMPDAESPFAREDGTLDEVVLLEMLAQTTAAYEGYTQGRRGDDRIKGLFLGARGFRVLRRPRAGEKITLRAEKETEFSGFAVARVQALNGDEVLAEGELKFWHD